MYSRKRGKERKRKGCVRRVEGERKKERDRKRAGWKREKDREREERERERSGNTACTGAFDRPMN